MRGTLAIWLTILSVRVLGFRYDERYIGYNLNQNPDATGPMEYAGSWDGVSYQSIHRISIPTRCHPPASSPDVRYETRNISLTRRFSTSITSHQAIGAFLSTLFSSING